MALSFTPRYSPVTLPCTPPPALFTSVLRKMSCRAALNPLRRAANAASKLQPKVAVRNMSGGGSIEEEVSEYQKWRSVTAVVLPGLIGFGVYTMGNLEHSHTPKSKMEHMNIRTKRYPWPNGDVALFDKCP
eukprot:8861655-Pyramimonas_sp.AAC.1